MHDVDHIVVGRFLNFMSTIEQSGDKINAYRESITDTPSLEEFLDAFLLDKSNVQQRLVDYLKKRRNTKGFPDGKQEAIDNKLIPKLDLVSLAVGKQPHLRIRIPLLKWSKIVAFAAYYCTIDIVKGPDELDEGGRCVENKPVMMSAALFSVDNKNYDSRFPFLNDIVVSILDQIQNLNFEPNDRDNGSTDHSFPGGLWGHENGVENGNGGNGNGGAAAGAARRERSRGSVMSPSPSSRTSNTRSQRLKEVVAREARRREAQDFSESSEASD